VSGALFALGAALLTVTRQACVLEASVQHWMLERLGIDALHLQTAVLFPIDGHLAGVTLSPGCSVGPLLGVFLLLASPVAHWREVRARRVLASAVALVGIFVLANQLRILVIVVAMMQWGFDRGYEVSHVFFGSAITTIGFVLGAIIFVRLFAPQPQPPAAP
jgi:exosortase/archaeosortase family protein